MKVIQTASDNKQLQMTNMVIILHWGRQHLNQTTIHYCHTPVIPEYYKIHIKLDKMHLLVLNIIWKFKYFLVKKIGMV
jgi:hypothetical protein